VGPHAACTRCAPPSSLRSFFLRLTFSPLLSFIPALHRSPVPLRCESLSCTFPRIPPPTHPPSRFAEQTHLFLCLKPPLTFLQARLRCGWRCCRAICGPPVSCGCPSGR
jgi:hypothetical protein